MAIEINREELAWAAGFFDGEGNFSYAETNGKYRTPMISFHVANTFMPTLERFQNAIGGLGKIYVQRKANEKHKACWQLKSGSFAAVQAVIAMLWPFMCEEKRGAAVSALRKYHARKAERSNK